MLPPPEKAYLLILVLTWLGVSVMKMAEVAEEADILELWPWRAGKNFEQIEAGLRSLRRGAMSRHRRK